MFESRQLKQIKWFILDLNLAYLHYSFIMNLPNIFFEKKMLVFLHLRKLTVLSRWANMIYVSLYISMILKSLRIS